MVKYKTLDICVTQRARATLLNSSASHWPFASFVHSSTSLSSILLVPLYKTSFESSALRNCINLTSHTTWTSFRYKYGLLINRLNAFQLLLKPSSYETKTDNKTKYFSPQIKKKDHACLLYQKGLLYVFQAALIYFMILEYSLEQTPKYMD